MNQLIKNLQLNRPHTAQPQCVNKLRKEGNMYQMVSVIGKRANQIAVGLHNELKAKLAEFDSYSELDEIQDNREQAEVSRLYETLPHPTLLAFYELKEDKLVYRDRKETEINVAPFLEQETKETN